MSGLTSDEPIRELVAGKYQLTRLLGRGGMGSVWEGVHSSLGTRVAVKFIESEYTDSADARSRFENEARAAARLLSKHVVKVYDHGLMPDGRPYIVMEYLAGEPLDNRLERVGRLPASETLRIVQQVARALTKAHAAGIVHRDLKPENVFLVWDDEDGADIAKVVDFGIAKFTNTNAGISSSTRTGSVLGTPYYMSPEQARGLRTVDARTDLWALAVIVYRCIIGELPFTGEAVGDLLVKICTAPFPIPSQVVPGLPPGFDAWFTKALDRDPERRFQSAAELADALSLALGIGTPVFGALGMPHSEHRSPGVFQTMPSSHLGYPTPGGVSPVQHGIPQNTPSGQRTPSGQGGPVVFGQGQALPLGTDTGSVGTGGAFSQTPAAGVPSKGSGRIIFGVLAGGFLLTVVAVGGVAAYVMNGGEIAGLGHSPGGGSAVSTSSVATLPLDQLPSDMGAGRNAVATSGATASAIADTVPSAPSSASAAPGASQVPATTPTAPGRRTPTHSAGTRPVVNNGTAAVAHGGGKAPGKTDATTGTPGTAQTSPRPEPKTGAAATATNPTNPDTGY